MLRPPLHICYGLWFWVTVLIRPQASPQQSLQQKQLPVAMATEDTQPASDSQILALMMGTPTDDSSNGLNEPHQQHVSESSPVSPATSMLSSASHAKDDEEPFTKLATFCICFLECSFGNYFDEKNH